MVIADVGSPSRKIYWEKFRAIYKLREKKARRYYWRWL